MLAPLVTPRRSVARGRALHAPGRAEQPIGTEEAEGIEDALDGAHEVQAHRVLCLEEVLELGRADAVLTGDGASGADGGLEDGMQQRMAALARRAGRSTGGRCRRRRGRSPVMRAPWSAASSATRARYSGMPARGMTASTMSSAPAALATKNAFSRAEMSCAPAVAGRTKTSRAPSVGEERGELLDVVLHPVRLHAFEHDDQIGHRRRPGLFGDAQVEPGAGGDAGHGQDVDVLEDARIDPAAHDVRHRLRHLGQGGEGRQDRRRLGQAWLDLQGDLGGDGQRPLRADEQLREVVTRGDLHELAAGAHDGTVGQHDLEAEDVVPRDAVAHGAHAAGVRGDVAPEGRSRLAGRDRVDQAQGRQAPDRAVPA